MPQSLHHVEAQPSRPICAKLPGIDTGREIPRRRVVTNSLDWRELEGLELFPELDAELLFEGFRLDALLPIFEFIVPEGVRHYTTDQRDVIRAQRDDRDERE